MPVFLLPPAAPRYGSGQASGGHSITPGIKSRKQSTRREAVLRGAYHHGGGGGSTRGVSYGLGLGDEEDDHPRQGAEASAEGGGEGEGVAVGGVEFVRQRTVPPRRRGRRPRKRRRVVDSKAGEGQDQD